MNPIGSSFFGEKKKICIFVIIERINMQISTFCSFCNRKREFNVILMHGMNGAFQIHKSRKYNRMQSCVIHSNDIKFSLLMTTMIKC